ncbi:response regulator transcription factor [Corynebacterium propinquum]|uniref:Response regulator transcription factor n=1 Tax=Corynebacterium propinquum TaxID=43769 RepID=A0AAP4F824_9CORY|nr:response regulator transcription factor [Corynebacterium propinquum]MDK4234687.1 response regulator transcription factor [Corynebacterium propinquum]MDK4257444.1 response regulator transcription factor [Corynebacterium propinquum]MDK4281636.1 response regulator transcription factor [Corynebacterium propinquum]MDK4292674.1 response regulator transcription factor [Corynebacterium propinquum]MDK4297833.1 response regulator transcription factor [Corynebacterium propinquum]
MAASGSKVYRLAIVEDHELTRQGLESMLNDNADFNVIASAANVPELFTALGRKRKVDLVVLDLRLSDESQPIDNVEKIEELTDNIVVLSSLESPYLLRQVLKTSVAEVLSKTQPSEEVVAAIRRTLSGKPAISTEMAAAMDGDPLLEAVDLSDRQREVLELYASGEPAKRVARLTGLKQDTVNDYLSRVRQKYSSVGRDTFTKLDLYQRAQEDGFLPGPTDPR